MGRALPLSGVLDCAGLGNDHLERRARPRRDALGLRILAGQGAPLRKPKRAARRAGQRGDTEALASPFQRANGDRTYIPQPRHEPVRRSSRHCGVHAHEKPQECLGLRNQHRKQPQDECNPALRWFRLVARASLLGTRSATYRLLSLMSARCTTKPAARRCQAAAARAAIAANAEARHASWRTMAAAWQWRARLLRQIRSAAGTRECDNRNDERRSQSVIHAQSPGSAPSSALPTPEAGSGRSPRVRRATSRRRRRRVRRRHRDRPVCGGSGRRCRRCRVGDGRSRDRLVGLASARSLGRRRHGKARARRGLLAADGGRDPLERVHLQPRARGLHAAVRGAPSRRRKGAADPARDRRRRSLVGARAHGVRAALWRSLLRLTPGWDRLQRDRSARLSRLCLRRAHAWHDLSGVGHELNQQGVAADGHAARADVVPLRLRDRRPADQLGRQPAALTSSVAGLDASGLASRHVGNLFAASSAAMRALLPAVSSSATIWSAAAIGTPMIAPINPKSAPNARTLVRTVKPETLAALPMIVGCRM